MGSFDLVLFLNKSNIMTTYEMIINKGKKEVFEEGFIEGIEEGKIESKIEVIINSFHYGLTVEMISRITGMTTEEVQRILSDKGLL